MRVNRDDLQALTRARLKDARALLRAKRYDAAYYVAGYAIECALKACIAKATKEFDFPEKDVVLKSYTHDLRSLLRVANLWDELERDGTRDEAFAAHWGLIEAWNELSRYKQNRTRTQAKGLYFAIAGRQHGVLKWLKRYW